MCSPTPHTCHSVAPNPPPQRQSVCLPAPTTAFVYFEQICRRPKDTNKHASVTMPRSIFVYFEQIICLF